MEIKTFDVLDSTNEYLKNKEKLEEYEVVIAKTQTNGRGKRGSVWISNEGAALFSFVIDSIGYDDKVTIYTGFIVRNILHKLIKEAFSENVESYLKFKWPNDIYYKDKKLCGILCDISCIHRWDIQHKEYILSAHAYYKCTYYVTQLCTYERLVL